jgi:DNA-binding transcriptional LysR family regulator
MKRMKHLVVLSEEGHFGRAAERLHLTQSALSRSVMAAEEELGLLLFDRGGLQVRCTDAGAFVIERARKLLFEGRNFSRDIDLYRNRQIGELAFGVGPFPAMSLAPQLVIEMRRCFPGVHARVEVNNWRFLLEHLRAEELDFFLADKRNIPPAPDLVMREIVQLDGAFYVRAGHPILEIENPDYARLFEQYGLATIRLPAGVVQLLAKNLGMSEGGRIPIALECDDLHFVRKVALSSDVILAYPTRDASADVRAGVLKQLNVPTISSETGIVSLKGRSFSLAAQFAIDYLIKIADHIE